MALNTGRHKMKLKRIHCLEISTTHIKLLTGVKLKNGLQIDRATIKPYESKAVLKNTLKEAVEMHGVDDGAVATTVWSPTIDFSKSIYSAND